MRNLVTLFFVGAYCYAFSQDVNLVTGTAQVSVSLASAQEKDINVPVVLNYFANGVRLQDDDGWVGHNWSLSVEFMVSRHVRGLPDDFLGIGTDTRRGWLHGDMGTRIKNYIFSTDNNPSTCSDEHPNWTFLNSFGYNEDTEPDIFEVSAPGIFFQFYFDENKMPQVVPCQDVLISRTEDPVTKRITSFSVIDARGVQFTFNDYELTTESLQSSPNLNYLVRKSNLLKKQTVYSNVWRLTTITSPIYGSISFDYKEVSNLSDNLYPNSEEGNVLYEHKFDVRITGSNGIDDHVLQYTRFSTRKILKKIASQTVEIEFLSTPKSGQVMERLNTINVYDNTQPRFLVKEISFSYNVSGNRAFLTGVTEKSQSKALRHTMEYYPGTLPLYNSPLKDKWGYYQSETAPYEETLLYGTLKRINFPLGGYAVYLYEPNEYRENDQVVRGAGVRVRKIIKHDGLSTNGDQTTDYIYNASDGLTSGKLISRKFNTLSVVRRSQPVAGTTYYREVQSLIAAGTLSGPIEQYFTVKASEGLSDAENLYGSSIGYEMVTVKKGLSGKRVYEFDLPGMLGEISANNGEWSRSEVHVARTSTGASGCFETGSIPLEGNQFPYPPNPNYDFARGLVKRVTDWNEQGDKVTEEVYEYQRIYKDHAIQKIYGLALEELPTYYYTGSAYVSSKLFLYSKYEIFTNVKIEVRKKISRVFASNDLSKKNEQITEFFYESANHRNVTKIASQQNDQTSSVVRMKYVSDYPYQTPADAQMNAIKKLMDSHRTNIVVESTNSIVKGGIEKYLSGHLTIFQTIGTSVFPYQQRIFNENDGTTSFVSSAAITTGGQTTFVNHPAYVVTDQFTAFDSYGNLTEMVGRDREVISTIWGYQGTLPAMIVSNARLAEIAGSDFETPLSTDFLLSWSPTYASAHTGTKGLVMPGAIGEQYALSKVVQDPQSQAYVFSCWIKASEAGNLTIKFKDGAAIITTRTLPFTSSSDWKFYTIDMPGSGLSSFKAVITTSNTITMDDVLLYPSQGNVLSYTYKIPYGKASEIDSRGTTFYYTYDEWGRLNVVYDRNLNIVNRYTYKEKP